MTDKLQDVAEQWIAEHDQDMKIEHEWCTEIVAAVKTADLRAFLAKFVLCEREPVGHVAPSSDGDAIAMTVAALRVPSDATTPLHAPATKEPKE